MSITNCRIKPFQFYPGIISCKLPVYLGSLIVSVLLPGKGLSFYDPDIVNSSVQALAGKNI